MRAAVLEGPRRIVLRSVDHPVPGADEVVVAVDACGVCGSDLHTYAGDHPVFRPPLVMGHEIIGRVVRTGGPAPVRPGDPVVVFPAIECGRCAGCRRGETNLCEGQRFLGGHIPGGFAEEVAVPARNCFPIPGGLDPKQAVLIEPALVGVHAVIRARLAPGERVVVLGAGPIGIVVLQAARAWGAASVLSVDPVSFRRDVAVAHGAAGTIDPSAGPVDRAVRDEWGGDLADVVFECVGAGPAIHGALTACRRGGRIALVGIANFDFCLPMLEIQRREREILGCQQYVPVEMPRAIELVARGAIGGAGLVTHVFDLDGTARAFETADRDKATVLKVIVTPSA